MRYTYDVAWDVSEAVESSQPCGQEENGEQRTYTVKRMLMKRSQLHPAMYAAAAGGKIIATYENENVEISITALPQSLETLTTMRTTSEPLTMLSFLLMSFQR